MSFTIIVANKLANSGVGETIAGDKVFTDCTVSISHTFANSVTEHPVETGVSFSDHVQNQNNRFSVTGIFSNVQLTKYAGDQLPYFNERVKAAYTFLKQLRDSRQSFTLVSMYDSYPDCVIESLDIPVSVESATSLYFTMNVVQIRRASTELTNIVQVDNVADFKKDDAAKGSNSGKGQSTDIGKSGLKQASGALVDVVKSLNPFSSEEEVLDALEKGTK